MSKARGATLDELTLATAWQKHTISAALSNLKKRHGLVIESAQPSKGVRTYRLVTPATEK